MKKFLSVLAVMALALVPMASYASNVDVGVGTNMHFYEDAEDSLGLYGKVKVSDVLIDNLSIRTGVEKVSTEVDYAVGVPGSTFTIPIGFITANGKLANGTSRGTFDLDLTTTTLEVGYDIDVMEGVTITPVVGPDFIFANADGEFEADNTVGVHVGVEALVQIKENVSFTSQIGYQYAKVDVDLNAVNGTVNGGEAEIDLSNIYVGGGINISF